MNSHMEELGLLANAIRETRGRHLNMQLLLGNLVARRRQVLNVVWLLLLLISQRNNITVPRSIRSCRWLNRNTGWWDKAWNNYSEARFKKTFRVSRSTFNFILNRIEPFITKQTVTEEPISAELRLALCLYRLGRGDYLYTIAEMSGLGDMEEFWQFPCCWAAIDGCHIPLKCPPGGLEACKEYHNFKNFYSIVLMGMVDSHYRFVWGSCGYPGNSHDAVIFRSTDLWSSIQDGFIPLIGKTVGDATVPPLIVGDSAFPLRTWLMKPFTNAVLTPQQHYFNYCLSRARMVTEGAYGQLKGRWRLLLRKSESDRDHVRTATLACMVLHNLCIMQGDTISKKLDMSTDSNGQKRN